MIPRSKWIAFALVFVITFVLIRGVGHSQDDPFTPTPDGDVFFSAGTSNDIWTPVIEQFNGIPFVYVPAGCFLMGSTDEQIEYALELGARSDLIPRLEQPPIVVCLESFWIMQTEVTHAMYIECVDAGGCADVVFSPFRKPEYADWPIYYLSWQRANEYAEWFGGYTPTEAQWEYAARGPESWIYPWGNEFDCTRGNFRDDGNCDGFDGYAPVGSFPEGASWVGALDMAGNAVEVTANWISSYGDFESPAMNPVNEYDNGWRALRGGGQDSYLYDLRSAARIDTFLTYTYNWGFRVVITDF